MPYIYLAIAIATELFGTTLLKYAQGFTKLWPSLGSIAAYLVSLIFLSKCLQNINLSIAYATWSALGILVSTLLSVFLFRQSITLAGIAGLALIVVGVAVLNLYGVPVK